MHPSVFDWSPGGDAAELAPIAARLSAVLDGAVEAHCVRTAAARRPAGAGRRSPGCRSRSASTWPQPVALDSRGHVTRAPNARDDARLPIHRGLGSLLLASHTCDLLVD